MKPFLTEIEEKQVVQAIKNAEKETSGEIKVHISVEPESDAMAKTISLFHELRMFNTQHRNGVLFHISSTSKTFTILGDEGIDKVTPNDFWDAIKETVIHHFTNQEFAEGLIKGIEMTGEALKKYFPYQTQDKNEISDEISYS